MAFGIPVDFYSLNNAIYNPGIHDDYYSNMWVTDRSNEELSGPEKAFLDGSFEDNHPGHIILGEATVTYNCHGYTFGVIQGTDRYNISWRADLCNGAFVLVNTPQAGDIALMRYDSGVPDSPHSAIVFNQDTVISKWGELPLTKHHKDSVIDIIAFENGDAHYTYYRRVVNTNSMISGLSTFNGTGTYIFSPNVTPATCTWSVEPADMFQNASGTGYTANLSYATPFVHLAPKATLTFTFSYGCDNHYTATKEIDLRIPTTTVSGNAVSDGFVIDANAVVTVTGKIKSNERAKTIVPVGTRLVIDNGIMTSNDDVMWQGIEVWGNSSTHQFLTNGSYGQGYLEMKNGATIENAKCAVELWRPNYWNTTGGIIHASDATFLNNATAVHALSYDNYNPANYSEADYNAEFKNCNFEVNEDYLGTETFTRHVTLAGVDGIRFLGCDFSAKRGVTGIDPWCMGITAYDAGFTVKPLCTSTEVWPCPEGSYKQSTFTGLCGGIRASSDGSQPRAFTVREAVFTNNDRGIRAINTGFPVILMNEFNISRDNTYCDFNYGIILDNVPGFCVEENSFHPVPGSGGATVGLAVHDSHSVNNIYRNSFTNLTRACLAFGQNVCSSTPGVVLGLTYTCNDFGNNQRDLMVLQEDGHGDIQPLQGTPGLSAGNTFRDSDFQIYNDGDTPITYYYNSNNPNESPSTSLVYNVYLNGQAKSNLCLSHYGNGPVDKSAQEKEALASEYLAAYSAYLNLKQLYDSRIDGGSTPAQLSDINAATPADMWELRARLLGLSPYVSKQVLAAAADRNDVFTDPVLFEILAANPDELRSDSLISYLENKEHPLPDYMISLLRQIAGGTTARTALMAEMNRLGHEYSLAAGDIVRSNLNDTVANPTELRNWLGSLNDIAADRMVISSYLHEGDSTSAFTLASMLPELYGLQGGQLEDHAGYMLLLQLYQTLKRTGRTVYELTETETAVVDSIVENGAGVSRVMARSLQEQVTGVMTETCLDLEEPELPVGDRSKAFVDEGSMNKAVGFTASLSPNPATTWAVVDYTLPSRMSKATVVLTNTLGVTVMTAELDGNHGQKVLDLRSLPVGVYLYTIRCGSYMETGKLVVTQ